jgi:hypothetical protein
MACMSHSSGEGVVRRPEVRPDAKKLNRICIIIIVTCHPEKRLSRPHCDFPSCCSHVTTHRVSYHTNNMDHSRDPCPWVILNDFGGAFAMGVRGGIDLAHCTC